MKSADQNPDSTSAKTTADEENGAVDQSDGKAAKPKSPLNIRPYFWIFVLSISSGLLVLFFGPLTTFLPDFDITCVRAASPSEGRIYDLDQNARTITSRLLTAQPDRGKSFRMVEVTDDPDQVYESTPPSPLDYAVMLHSLRLKGANNIILTTRMSWDGDPGITAEALSNKLAAFDRASFGVPVTRGATAQPLPEALQRALIPFSNVSGNLRLIPVVNQVALPAVISGGKNSLGGFSTIESTPDSKDYVPMLCHWDGEGLIPSLELLALMSSHNVNPKQVIVRCGKHIRLGLQGPVINIDSYGETILPEKAEKSDLIDLTKDAIAAEDLITRQEDGAETPEDRRVYLVHAVGEKTKPTNQLSPVRLAAILNWSKNLLSPEPGRSITYKRLPLWAEIVLIFDIALAACWFTSFSRGGRHLAFALTAALSYPFLLSIMDLTQHWLSVSSLLVTVLVAWLVPVRKRKHTTSIQEYSTSDPKPVLRA
ncbi:hypothetical protein NT6N_32550 [Oceaniferula spumae]|uniref:CHASE2 domain-containing protein n=1 Tax=Oceaniferula spumae TaxID=2979115 RepID=A0AAT9FQA6_9BACT